MKRDKIARLTLAAALASTIFVATPESPLAQTTSDVLTTLASQVQAYDFAASRNTINELQQVGIGSITVGSETVSLGDLLVMIEAAEAGTMDPAALASYLAALAASTGQALFVPAQPSTDTSDDTNRISDDSGRAVFPTGSEG